MILAIDFDGTLVEHRYPDIGPENPGAIAWCRRFQAAGARLILLTMRSNRDYSGDQLDLDAAVAFCRERGLEFWAVNDNPEQGGWNSSRKVYAHRYIDDANAGCPLRASPRMGGRPMVDWDVVGPLVLAELERSGRGR